MFILTCQLLLQLQSIWYLFSHVCESTHEKYFYFYMNICMLSFLDSLNNDASCFASSPIGTQETANLSSPWNDRRGVANHATRKPIIITRSLDIHMIVCVRPHILHAHVYYGVVLIWNYRYFLSSHISANQHQNLYTTAYMKKMEISS